MVNGLSGEHPSGGIDFPRKIESRLLGELPAAQWQSTLFLRASGMSQKQSCGSGSVGSKGDPQSVPREAPVVVRRPRAAMCKAITGTYH